MLPLISRTAFKSCSKLVVDATYKQKPFLSSQLCIVSTIFREDMHSCRFTRHLTLLSNDPLPKSQEIKVLDSGGPKKPLVLLYNWMLAKEKHVAKYAKFYTDLGADVLRIRISPFDMLRPTKGSHIVADNVLDFLHSNDKFSPLLIHGFSVGAYVFNEMMVKVAANMNEHGPLLNRFVGQIWDSAVDIQGIPYGLSRAVSNNKVIQTSFEKYMRWYLKYNYDVATVHYAASSQKMHENYVNVPGLFFFSNRDLVGSPEMNMGVVRDWEKKNCPVFTKCFESSPHVSHYHYYKEDYEAEIMAFLEKLGLLHNRKGVLGLVQ